MFGIHSAFHCFASRQAFSVQGFSFSLFLHAAGQRDLPAESSNLPFAAPFSRCRAPTAQPAAYPVLMARERSAAFPAQPPARITGAPAASGKAAAKASGRAVCCFLPGRGCFRGGLTARGAARRPPRWRRPHSANPRRGPWGCTPYSRSPRWYAGPGRRPRCPAQWQGAALPSGAGPPR